LRLQHQSDGIKKGEPKNHKSSVQFVIDWYYENNPGSKLIATKKRIEKYNHGFVEKNKMHESGYSKFEHPCDLVFEEIETIENAKIAQKRAKIFIEIDGERHDNNPAKIADGLFDKWVEETYNLSVYRIPKYIFQNTTEDLTNEELSRIYLREFAREESS